MKDREGKQQCTDRVLESTNVIEVLCFAVCTLLHRSYGAKSPNAITQSSLGSYWPG